MDLIFANLEWENQKTLQMLQKVKSSRQNQILNG